MNKKIFFLLSFILVIFLSNRYLVHRQIGYQEIPKTTDILDEKNNIWAAKSFLQTGIPTAWSMLDAYKINGGKGSVEIEGLSIKVEGEKPSLSNISKFDYPVVAVTEIDVGKGREHILFVQPFLDYSFLTGLIFGLKTPDKLKSFADVIPEQYRLAAIYVSIITGILLFFLTYLIDQNHLSAIVSFLIYSTVSVYILVSRYALIENLLIPVTLISLIFLVLFRQKWIKKNYQKRLLLIVAGIAAGLAATFKETGVAVIIAGMVILLLQKIRRKEIIFFILPALAFGSLFYIYALFVSPKLFFNVFFNQIDRGFFGSLNFIYSFYRPHFAGFPLEGWWPFGFITIAFLVKEFKKYQEIIISFLSYLFVLLFFGVVNYPWYSLVFVPFLIIASAVFIKDLLFRPTAIKMIIFFLFPFSSTLYWGYNVFHQHLTNVIIYRASILIFLFLIILSFLKKKRPWLGIVITLILIAVLFKTYQWNLYGFTYLIANWGKLPEQFFLKL